MRISDWSSDVCSSYLGSSGTGDGTITRFTLRFSEDMVPLGDPPAPAPATNDCNLPSSARCAATRTWVLAFDQTLPGGPACPVALRCWPSTAPDVSIGGKRGCRAVTRGPPDPARPAGRKEG